MSERLKESLSAAIDSEADEFELRRVLDETQRSGELADAWHRYHLIGAQLRGELSGPAESMTSTLDATRSMADAVWAAVHDEAGPVDLDEDIDVNAPAAVAALAGESSAPAPVRSGLSAWTGIGVAAGVALAVLVGFFAVQDEPPAPEIATNAEPLDIDGPIYQVREGTVSANDVQRANAYMLHHVQHTALNKAGVASFVKLVTFEPVDEE